MEFIETVRVGSHHEYIGKWNPDTKKCDTSTKPKRGYCHKVICDYTTIFHDCLPGKAWLATHHKDEYPEPTIEVIVTPLTPGQEAGIFYVNGNYKKGIIAGFLAGYTSKTKVGRRNVVLGVGIKDDNH